MLKARVLTASGLVLGLLGVLLFLPDFLVAAVLAGVAGLAAWEWAGLMSATRSATGALVAVVFAACLYVWFNFAAATGIWWLSLTFWCLVAPLFLWKNWPLKAGKALALILGGILIVAAWAAMVSLHARAPLGLLAAMALIWVADSAAYFSGRAFGRHKLAPRISPGKTWEGVAGAVIGVLAYAFLLRERLPEMAVGFLAFAALALLALSIIGDLFESLAKRQAEMKDSGSILPGHGGVLDRIDSLLPTLPVVALLSGRVAG